MGLAGRKQKQRIGHDPRNLSWADDASRFGQNYLAKFGWDASKGLGAQGEGRTSAIKVSQKLDMMGIGAAHTKDPNGIAWKQSKDYENLLARLNAAAAGETYAPATGVVAEGGFVKPTEEGSGEGENANAVEVKENASKVKEKAGEAKEKTKEELKREQKEKKRKRKEQEGEDGEKKSKKRKKDQSEDSTPAPAADESSDDEPLPAPAPRPVLRRAHRSRHIAFKSMATKDATAVAEILGVAPTPSSLSSTASPMGALTPISDETATMEKLTRSTKSVADYFKERLAAKAAAKSGSSTPVPPSGAESAAEESTFREESEAPRGGLGSSRRREEEDAPRGGLGSRSGLGSSSGLGFGGGLGFSGSRPRDDDDSAPRGGLGSFARMFQMPSTAPTTETGKGMAMFAALSSSKVLSGEAAPAEEVPATETEKERRKREKKEKKRKAEEAQEYEEKAAKKEKAAEKEKRRKSEAEDEVAPRDVGEESDRKEKKKDKKGKAKQSDADEVTAEAVDDGRKESKKRKRDKQIDDDSMPSAVLTPSNDSEATSVDDAKTKEERKAEKRRRKEEQRRKEA